MLTEEQQEQQERRPWQLRNKKTSTSSDMKRVAWPPVGPHMAPEVPSANEHDNGTASVLQQNGAEEITQYYQNDTNRFSNQHQVSPGSKVAPPVPPKPGAREIANAQQSAEYDSDNTMAANGMPEAFASNELVGERLLIAKPAPPPGLILLKKHAPISQEPQAVFNSQPVFKRATPVRMLGDMVWPPKGAGGSSDNSTQSPGVVRRQPKNYQEFFSSNQLPANFPTYRAPPGTQHFGLEEGENTTPMWSPKIIAIWDDGSQFLAKHTAISFLIWLAAYERRKTVPLKTNAALSPSPYFSPSSNLLPLGKSCYAFFSKRILFFIIIIIFFLYPFRFVIYIIQPEGFDSSGAVLHSNLSEHPIFFFFLEITFSVAEFPPIVSYLLCKNDPLDFLLQTSRLLGLVFFFCFDFARQAVQFQHWNYYCFSA